jgi:hypothetical protein
VIFWFRHRLSNRVVRIETRHGLAHCLASPYWAEVRREWAEDE